LNTRAYQIYIAYGALDRPLLLFILFCIVFIVGCGAAAAQETWRDTKMAIGSQVKSSKAPSQVGWKSYWGGKTGRKTKV